MLGHCLQIFRFSEYFIKDYTMEITPNQLGVGIPAVLAVAVVALALWLLINLLIRIGKFATITSLSIFIGILIGLIVDVRLVLLSTGIVTLLGEYEGGNWKYLAAAFAIEGLSLSGLYIFSFFSVAISNKDDKFTKEIKSAVKGGSGFWGVFGAVVSFSLCCYIAMNVFKLPVFFGLEGSVFKYSDAVQYALQIVVEMVPVLNLERSFGFKLSSMTLNPQFRWFGSIIFVYQTLLTLSLAQVIVFFWKMRNSHEHDPQHQ